MPKENVHCTANRSEDPSESWRAEVSWAAQSEDRYGHVSIGTVNPLSPFRWGQVEDKADGAFTGWHVSLDRAQINRLIWALRRARDQAYGADA